MTPLGPLMIDQFAQAFLDGGRQMHTRLQGVADSLYGGLLLLTFTTSTIGILLESMSGEHLGSVLSHLIRTLFMAGVVSWFLEAYDWIFYQGVYGGCLAVMNAISGVQGQTQGFATAWGVFSDILLTIWNSLVSSPERFLAGATPLSWAFWAALGGWVVSDLLLLVALALFVLALVILAVIHVMGCALTGIALALGPFFIPWLLWDATREYFAGWLRYLFVACFYNVVSVTVLALSKPVFVNLEQWVTAQSGVLSQASAADTLALALLLIVMASIIVYLMGHVPQIAAGLIGHGRVDTGFATQSQRYLNSRVGQANDWMAGRLRQQAKSHSAGGNSANDSPGSGP